MNYDYDIQCPFCKFYFGVDEWEDGECPRCKESYWWEENYYESLGDSYVEIQWNWNKFYEKEKD